MMKKLKFESSNLPKDVWKVLSKLNTPAKIQDYINTLSFNHKNGEEPPLISIKSESAHCLEGALIAAVALWIQGEKPFLLDLQADKKDKDHVVAIFKKNGLWGAISKTNHSVLRYREPVYRSVRELAMSYFHEYYLEDGRKTMRSFSKPFDLSRLGTKWLYDREAVVELAYALDKSPHINVLKKGDLKKLRKADKIEIESLDREEWPSKK